MATQEKPVRRIMRAFKLNEISTVDNPAQAGALMAVMKKEKPGMTTRVRLVKKDKVAKPDDLVAKIVKYCYVDPAQGARSFADILECYERDKTYTDLMQVVSPFVSALDTSLRSIIADKDVESAQKPMMMRSTVEEFLAAIKEEWPDVEEELSEALKTATATTQTTKGDDEMAKTLDELKKQVEDLMKKLTDVSKAEKPDEAAAQIAAISKELGEVKDELEEANKAAKAKKPVDDEDEDDMDDAMKQYVASLSAKARKEFMALKPAERKKKMKAKKSEDEDGVTKVDETVEVAGRTVSKSAVGDDMFAILKAQAEETEELKKAFLREQDLREMEGFTKRAETELGHLPGTVEEKAKILKSLAAMPEEQRKVMDQILKAGDKAVSAAFDKIGHKKNIAATNGADFTKKVAEIKARDKCTNTEAMQKARKEHPEAYAAFQGEEVDAN